MLHQLTPHCIAVNFELGIYKISSFFFSLNFTRCATQKRNTTSTDPPSAAIIRSSGRWHKIVLQISNFSSLICFNFFIPKMLIWFDSFAMRWCLRKSRNFELSVSNLKKNCRYDENLEKAEFFQWGYSITAPLKVIKAFKIEITVTLGNFPWAYICTHRNEFLTQNRIRRVYAQFKTTIIPSF